MTAATSTTDEAEGAAPARKGGKKKLLILAAIPLLLAAGGGAGWYFGALESLGIVKKPPTPEQVAAAAALPTYVQLPEIVANLNAGGRRTAFVKLQAKLELSRPEDLVAFTAAQPRVLDLFQTYLREMRPEELHGSLGTYRLREQLIARASLAAAPARVTDVLFTELLVQ